MEAHILSAVSTLRRHIRRRCTSSAKISLDIRTVDMASNLLLANLGNSFSVSKQYMLANIQYMWHHALNCNCWKYSTMSKILIVVCACSARENHLTAEALHYIKTHYNCGIYIRLGIILKRFLLISVFLNSQLHDKIYQQCKPFFNCAPFSSVNYDKFKNYFSFMKLIQLSLTSRQSNTPVT